MRVMSSSTIDEEVISRLLITYKRRWRPDTSDPFKSLVMIILSQNTNPRNVATAYSRLESSIGISPENLAHSSIEKIRTAIKPAGIYHKRSIYLKDLAQKVLLRFNGDIASILTKPYAEAKNILMSLPGVGPKTADVLLMFNGGMSVIPVDRHIFRISKRLEIVPANARYESVRSVLEKASPVDRYEDVHVLLIRFGREICRAQNPKCSECFLNDICPFPQK